MAKRVTIRKVELKRHIPASLDPISEIFDPSGTLKVDSAILDADTPLKTKASLIARRAKDLEGTTIPFLSTENIIPETLLWYTKSGKRIYNNYAQTRNDGSTFRRQKVEFRVFSQRTIIITNRQEISYA